MFGNTNDDTEEIINTTWTRLTRILDKKKIKIISYLQNKYHKYEYCLLDLNIS